MGYKDPDTLERLYWSEGLSTNEIGDRFGVSGGAVTYWMKKNNIDRRKPNHKKPVWFGLDRVRDFWYECWKHNMTEGTKKVWLHRLLAVSEYGYDEVCRNDVHHKNEITWDNRPENIELMEHAEHRSHHTK